MQIEKQIAIALLVVWTFSGWSAIWWYASKHEISVVQKIFLSVYGVILGPCMWSEAIHFDKINGSKKSLWHQKESIEIDMKGSHDKG